MLGNDNGCWRKIESEENGMKKKMYKKLAGMAGMSMMAFMCFTGCSQETPESSKWDVQQIVNDEKDADSVKENQNEQIQEEQPMQEEQGKSDLYAGADLQGSVVEFSDGGFELSAAEVIKEDEGSAMVQAAPGAENEEDLVTITYSSDVTFEIITMDSASLTEISREDTDKQSIKKQTNVLVFGSCQDTYHWTADKVVIMRWK